MVDVAVVQRPMRLIRTILLVLGTALVLIGGVLLLRAVRNPDLTNLEGWVAWIGAPLTVTAELPDRLAASFSCLALTVGVLLIVASGWLSWWVRTRPVSAHGHDLRIDASLWEVEEERTLVSLQQAFIFWQCLHDPTKRYQRISESVEPGSRTFRVTTTLAVEPTQLGSQIHAVPVALFTRGQLEHGLQFSVAGERASSYSHVKSAVYAAQVVDQFIRTAGGAAHRAYIATSPGCPPLRQRVQRVLSSTADGGETDAIEVAKFVAQLPSSRRQQDYLNAAATVVAYLAEQHPVCVPVRSEAEHRPIRVTMERVVFPAITNYDHSVINLRARIELVRKRIVQVQRSMFAVTPHTVDYSTRMAERTASYHLNIRGPEGFYLAHQELRNDALGRTLLSNQLQPLEYSMNPRRGQRTGHLYVRNGSLFKTVQYSCTFYERMPGSMSTAFVAALATTLVALALAWSVLFTDDEQSGLLQIMLAFPLALTATSSSRRGAPFWGGDLGARWATIITVAVITMSLLASTIGTGSSREAQVVYWSVLLVLSASNAILCLVSWASRAMTYHSFLGR